MLHIVLPCRATVGGPLSCTTSIMSIHSLIAHFPELSNYYLVWVSKMLDPSVDVYFGQVEFQLCKHIISSKFTKTLNVEHCSLYYTR